MNTRILHELLRLCWLPLLPGAESPNQRIRQASPRLMQTMRFRLQGTATDAHVE